MVALQFHTALRIPLPTSQSETATRMSASVHAGGQATSIVVTAGAEGSEPSEAVKDSVLRPHVAEWTVSVPVLSGTLARTTAPEASVTSTVLGRRVMV